MLKMSMQRPPKTNEFTLIFGMKIDHFVVNFKIVEFENFTVKEKRFQFLPFRKYLHSFGVFRAIENTMWPIVVNIIEISYLGK